MHTIGVEPDHLGRRQPGWTGAEGWLHEVAALLSRPVEHLPAEAWSLLLTRSFPFGLVQLPPDTVEVYRRCWWVAGPPRTPVDLRVGVRWVERRHDASRVAIESHAYADERELAGAVTVLHLPGDRSLAPAGEPWLPSAPAVPEPEAVRSCIVGAHEVQQLEDVLDRRSPLTDNPSFAHRHGFPAALTPALLLLGHAYQREAAWPEAGTLDMWLQRPVPLGAVIEVCRTPADPDLRALRLLRGGQPAVVLRRRSDVERL